MSKKVAPRRALIEEPARQSTPVAVDPSAAEATSATGRSWW